MKQLQCNFTTPEQSKRLLELGVPRYSADMWYIGAVDAPKKYPPFPSFSYWVDGMIYERDLPCWSVGRLIEIYEIVGENAGQCVSTTKSTSRIESLVQLYEENATLLDFSKLEE